MYEALQLVREHLGPDAAVLHTRECCSRRWFGLLPGRREIEVTASNEVNVPSRLAPRRPRVDAGLSLDGLAADGPVASPDRSPSTDAETAPGRCGRGLAAEAVHGQLADLHQMVRELCRRSHAGVSAELPEELFRLFTELLDADLSEELARELVDRVRAETRGAVPEDPALLIGQVASLIENEIRVTGPIAVAAGRRRVVALVGPTGVGKTTTIAKLAAHYRLREKARVGLITVDTYRVAAVEQLRTYADIIDLPMEVVSTLKQMREAVRRLEGLDLVLLDTAGRSPRDEVKIQELRAMLAEARADEVHLVLSTVAGERILRQTAERFAAVGTTALLLTKLDESSGLGAVLPLLRASGLPVSYWTDGQNVPDDIETANARRLARMILALEPLRGRH